MEYVLTKFSLCSQDNVALIVVLEAKVNNQPVDNPGKRQLLCVVYSFTLLLFVTLRWSCVFMPSMPMMCILYLHYICLLFILISLFVVALSVE